MGKVQVYQEPNRGEHLIGKTGNLPNSDVHVLATLFLDSLEFCCCKYYMFLFLAETRVQIQESVRGKDVFIIQTVSK